MQPPNKEQEVNQPQPGKNETDRQPLQPSDDPFVPVREPGTGKLLMRYNPQRHLVEIQRRGRKSLIDLTQYEEKKRKGGSRRRDV